MPSCSVSSCCGSSRGSAAEGLSSVTAHRQLGTSTDDAAIFLEDSMDRVTAQCIDASPSAMALLSPQRMPSSSAAYVDVTEYDSAFIGSLSSSHRKSSRGNSSSGHANHVARGAAHEDTTPPSDGPRSPSSTPVRTLPTPTSSRSSTSYGPPAHHASYGDPATHHARGHSPAVPEPVVSLAEYESLQRERNRFEKMYEHQRALYEEMADKHADTYQLLQDKIVEVVALSTRNEESKRFIRQLKREMSDSRTRVMDMQNRVLEEAKSERSAKMRSEELIQEYKRKYEHLLERHETELAGMESLVKDLMALRGDRSTVHTSQLDSLLKATYTKSSALFSDLLRQGRQIDLLYDAKGSLEEQIDQLRKEKREQESAMREERRAMASTTGRMIEQMEEQQQSILNLRQMLIRTMDNRNGLYALDDERGCNEDLSDERDEDDCHREDGSRDHLASSALLSSEVDAETMDTAQSMKKTKELVRKEEKRSDGPGETPGGGRNLAEKLRTQRDESGMRSPKKLRVIGTARPTISDSSETHVPLTSNGVKVLRQSSVTTANTGTTKLISEVPALPLTFRETPELRQAVGGVQRGSSLTDGSSTIRSTSNDDPSESTSDSLGPPFSQRKRRGGLAPADNHNEDVDHDIGVTPAASAATTAIATRSSRVAATRARSDFLKVLATVTEKRRRDRVAQSDVEKENKLVAPQHPIVRACGVGSISTARKTPLTERGNVGTRPDEDEEEPRLCPSQVQRSHP